MAKAPRGNALHSWGQKRQAAQGPCESPSAASGHEESLPWRCSDWWKDGCVFICKYHTCTHVCSPWILLLHQGPSWEGNLGYPSRNGVVKLEPQRCGSVFFFFFKYDYVACCWGKHTDWNRPPWPATVVTICMSCFMTGDPDKEHGTNKPPPTGRVPEMSKGDTTCPATSQNHSC